MRYVADTHVLVWVTADAGDRSLGSDARRIWRRAERGLDEISVSTVTLFEVLLLVERRRRGTPARFVEWKAGLDEVPWLRVEPLTDADVDAARGLAAVPDPCDRLIAATALRLGVPLLTAD